MLSATRGVHFRMERTTSLTRGSFQDEKDNQGRHEHDRPKLQNHEISLFNSTPFILLHVPHCFSDQLMCMIYCVCSKPLSKTKWSVTWHGRLASQQRKLGSARCSRMLLLHQSINKYKMAALLGCYGKFVGTSWLRILVHITTVHRRNNFQHKAQHSAHRSAGQGCSASAFSVPGKLFNRRRHHYVLNGIIVLGPVTGDNSWDSTLETTDGL